MAAQTTDLLIIKRGATHYKTSVADILALVTPTTINDTLTSSSTTEALSANQGRALKALFDGFGDITVVANTAAKTALTGLDLGDIIHVVDDGDTKWARYQITAITDGAWGTSTSVKIGDQDWTGIAAPNLGYTAAPTQGTVTNSAGTSAVIPAVDVTNAGLMLPAHFTKLGFISVTQAVDLDALETASHAAVTLAGSAATNPLTLAGQVAGFDIAQLTVAP